jgi:hypothetical protein
VPTVATCSPRCTSGFSLYSRRSTSSSLLLAAPLSFQRYAGGAYRCSCTGMNSILYLYIFVDVAYLCC